MNYICECGKEFTNSQSFNAHKSHCKDHYLVKYGNLDFLNVSNKKRALAAGIKIKVNTQTKRDKDLQQWISEQHKCEKCGKIMTEKFGSGRFCCRACANSRDCTKETKEKISLGLINSTKIQNHLKAKNAQGELVPVAYCAGCGKPLFKKNKFGYCGNCFKYSKECFQFRSAISIQTRDRLRAEGKQFGFPTRNIISYPEKFWAKVLKNNNINYQKEVKVSNDHNSCYFLDFLIKINNIKIDLEIDGQQHLKPERIESDKIRDAFLSKEYIIYRVPWNEINSEQGKILMQDKINKFLQFYQNYLHK